MAIREKVLWMKFMKNVLLWRTVKHAYSEHAYNELTLIVKWFSFPVGLKHIVKLMDIMNYVYNKAKSTVPGTLL